MQNNGLIVNILASISPPCVNPVWEPIYAKLYSLHRMKFLDRLINVINRNHDYTLHRLNHIQVLFSRKSYY